WIFSSHIQCSNSFRPVHFVCAKSHAVNAEFLHIASFFSNKLRSVAKENQLVVHTQLRNFFDWLNHPRFIVCSHHTYHYRVWFDGTLHFVHINQTFAVNTQVSDL